MHAPFALEAGTLVCGDLGAVTRLRATATILDRGILDLGNLQRKQFAHQASGWERVICAARRGSPHHVALDPVAVF